MEPLPTFDAPTEITLEQALSNIGNVVYQAVRSFENLENQEKLHGNGHHLRQEMALRAQMLLYEHWADQDEKSHLDPTHPAKEAVEADQANS